MKIEYDRQTKRLLYFKSDSIHSWDKQWAMFDIKNTAMTLSGFNLVSRTTKKYLNIHDGPILEGGCGLGQFVYGLTKTGYDCVGIDNAEETVARIRQTFSDLNVKVMDVTKLDFPDNHFAGYWSLGVIEHFQNGYDEIVDEMFRVVMPGGYVFLTVPAMSRLRKCKAVFGKYPEISCNMEKGEDIFYQYAFSPEELKKDFRDNGFNLITASFKGGIKGLRDEVPIFGRAMRFLNEIRQKNIATKCLFVLLDALIAPLAGHVCFFVFQKPKHD